MSYVIPEPTPEALVVAAARKVVGMSVADPIENVELIEALQTLKQALNGFDWHRQRMVQV